MCIRDRRRAGAKNRRGAFPGSLWAGGAGGVLAENQGGDARGLFAAFGGWNNVFTGKGALAVCLAQPS